MDNIIILGVNADIGRNICKLFHDEGFSIIGTYRRDFPEYAELEKLERVRLVQCDLLKLEDIQRLTDFIQAQNFRWTTLFSSVGTSEPIGRFFDLDFGDWEQSVNVNMTSQLRAVHALYALRDTSQTADIALLAGGGTNNPFRCYSAYCVAKIGLIKMCELIDDETEDVNIFILGPGFVKTKTHLETMKAGAKAESNFERVRQFLEKKENGTKFEDIYECLLWAKSMGREVVGGRNLSVVHDKWGTEILANELRQDNNMYKLRRFRNN
jgi:NAD(P)-dependent dehydrogenase (short-subunit alcohol dehydrogenase family)